MKLIVVVRYDFDESETSPVATRLDDLHERLDGFGPGRVWVAIGEPCERVSAAVDAEETGISAITRVDHIDISWPAERDRYRAALQQIADQPLAVAGAPNIAGWHNQLIDIARKALER
jgi:hypothetical protein